MRLVTLAGQKLSSLLSTRAARLAFWIAVLSRLALVFIFPVSEGGSGRRYVDPASSLLSGHWGAPEISDQLPGAPLFFIPFFALFGERYFPVALGQHVLGLLGLLLLMSAAKTAWGESAAAWTGLLVAAQFILPFQECFLLSESVGQFWLAAALFLAVSLRHEEPGPRRWAMGGGAAAMAALTRGEYFFLGPMTAFMLLLPINGSKAAPRKRLLLYLGVWALFIGGWTLRNTLAGYAGFNSHGPTVLLDTALPLVRWDLPTEPLAKRVLKEQVAVCETAHCDPRPTTLYRLEHEFGYSFLEANKAVGRIGREAVFTQPMKFLPMFWKNMLTFFLPSPWVTDERYDPRKPIKDSIEGSRVREGFWRGIESGPQYAGWALIALGCLSPVAFFLAPPRKRWAAAFALGCALCVAATASLFRAVARTQADLYLPLGLLGAFAADGLFRRQSRTPAVPSK